MKEQKEFLIIAGTVYGRKMADFLCKKGAKVYATVATEYGESVLQPHENLTVLSGRLSLSEMEGLINKLKPDAVINTTHPYAVEVSENIKAACEHTGAYYLRLSRDENDYNDLIHVNDLEEAAIYLTDKEGNIFSACGSKEMHKLTAIKDYNKRVYIRALPLEEFIKKGLELGFAPSNLICMQGPFSKDLNKAMLKSTNAKYLITKDSGSAGGFNEKIEAANELGITTIVIGRPLQQNGYDYEEIIEIIMKKFNLLHEGFNYDTAHYFPMFISLKGKNVKVFGAGTISARRIETLKQFDCSIEVIAPINKLNNSDGIKIQSREYSKGDCSGADLVVAATNDREVNRKIAQECNQNNIPVSVCDDMSLCAFYFPAVVVKDEIVIGVTSSGKDHKKVKDVTNQIRELMDK